MAGTGELERAVLQVLWDSRAPLAARDVLAALPERDGSQLAVTTVLTVLDRLRRKGLVRRERSGRAHLYQAAVTREDYVADLMLAALGTAPDRGAALTRFLGAVTPADTDHLRQALQPDADRAPGGTPNADAAREAGAAPDTAATPDTAANPRAAGPAEAGG